MGAVIRRGDRLLLRTDINKTYMMDDWEKRAPYLRSDGTRWCIEKGVVLVGYDFYHGVDEPGRRACSMHRAPSAKPASSPCPI